MSTQPDKDEKEPDSQLRISGKTIREWKDDCETFYQEWAACQENNAELSLKNTELENKITILTEQLRRLGKHPDA